MVSREGVIQISLNAVIGLFLVGIVISVGVFAYTSVIASLTTSQVTKGFEDFITPIQQVCQGKPEGLQGEIMLPVTNEYTYGIIQMRIRNWEPNMPLPMKKCEDGYCLCLFRLKKDNYEFWDTTPTRVSNFLYTFWNVFFKDIKTEPEPTGEPAPIWHFNQGGKRIFPPLIQRVIIFYALRLAENIFLTILPHLVTNTVCTSITCASTACAGVIACNAAFYAIVVGLSRGVLNALITLMEESTEPFLLVNYPLNFMSTKNAEYLYWTNSSNEDVFNPALAMRALDASDWKTIGWSFASGFFEGAVDGALYGLFNAKGSSNAWKTVSESVWKKIGIKIVQGLISSTIKVAGGVPAIKMRQQAGIRATEFTIPVELRPQATVRALLNTRVQMNLDKFIIPHDMYYLLGDAVAGAGIGAAVGAAPGALVGVIVAIGKFILIKTEPKPPDYTYTTDTRVNNFNGFDIINCASISELGPACDENTKIRMDYDHDMILSYRITDPINYPEKSIFCGYSNERREFAFNIVNATRDMLLEQVKKTPDVIESVLDKVINIAAVVVDFVIGDLLLAGQQSVQGLFMECIESSFIAEYKSEYFQYWIPYYDTTGITGTTGSISVMRAKLVPETSNVQGCQQDILTKWNNCRKSYRTSASDTTYTELLKDKEAVCPYNEASNTCDTTKTLPQEINATCVDVYHPAYLECEPGIHVTFGGVVQ